MKASMGLGACALVLAVALPAVAQGPDPMGVVPAQMGPRMGGPAVQGERRWDREPGPVGHGHMRQGRSAAFMALRHQKELGLSAQQVSSLQQLGLDTRRVFIKGRADVQLARLDLFSLLRAEQVDMGKVEAKVREIERLRSDAILAGMRANEAAKGQLTPEQREKLKALRAAVWQGRGRAEGDGGSEARPGMRERS